MQFQSRIGQGNAHTIERWTYPPNNHLLRIRPCDDESSDEHLFTREDPHPGGDVKQLRRWNEPCDAEMCRAVDAGERTTDDYIAVGLHSDGLHNVVSS